MIWKAIMALFAAPMTAEPIHDDRVHKLIGEISNLNAARQLVARRSRRLSQNIANPQDIQHKLDEAAKIISDVKKVIDEHDDPDDGLLRDADRSLGKDETK